MKNPMRAKSTKFAETLRYFTRGYSADLGKILEARKSPQKTEVLLRNVPFYSLCEHHLLPFYGTITLAYLPDGLVLGIGRVQDLVDALSRRLQTQEKMTEELAQALQKHLKPKGTAFFVEATHFCTLVKNGKTTRLETTAFEGAYAKDAERRKEFLMRVQGKRK